MPPLATPSEAAPLAARPGTDLARLPLDQSPAAVYLSKLAATGRRTQRTALDTMAALLGQGDALSCPWERLRYQHTAALRTALAERYAPSTMNKMLCALRGVLHECWNLGLMTHEEAERAANVKSAKLDAAPRGRALSMAEVGALLAACARDASPLGRRDAALIAVMTQGGPRRSEVVALQLADYNCETGALEILHGKGDKRRTIYVLGGAARLLDAWLEVRGGEPGPIFTSTTSAKLAGISDQAVLVILRKRASEAGVAALSPHDLRRTMITELLSRDADVFSVQRLAGHSDPKTTSRYDRRREDAKRAAAARLELVEG